MEIEMSTQRISKPDILAKIEVYKRQEILLAKQKTSVDAMRKLARQAPTPRALRPLSKVIFPRVVLR
jgi:hypothetical protein